jgi:hypothetical protein
MRHVAAEGMAAWRIGCSREVLAPREEGSAGLRILENLANYRDYYSVIL